MGGGYRVTTPPRPPPIAGTTLLGTSALAVSTALSTAYSVTTTIEIINHSKWDLVYPTAYTEWGYIKSGHE